MTVTKFHENRLIIDRYINEKHALLVECGPGYNSNRLESRLGLDYYYYQIITNTITNLV